MNKHLIAVHGGAGTILRNSMTPALEANYKKGLLLALETGSKVLDKGGSALDAVEQAIIILENDPLLNAGKGAVFTHEGKNEMDASIMWGKDLSAGAVAGVANVKNPIMIGRAGMGRQE